MREFRSSSRGRRNIQDLETAKALLKQNDLTLLIVKNGKTIFETSSHGISGFLDAIDEFGSRLSGASVADKIVGKAIALLCVYVNARAVYAINLSRGGEIVLRQNGIYHESDSLVNEVLDRWKSGLCPFESSVTMISNPVEAYAKLRTLRDGL